jgi:phospholipid/cholesterol/gamma-HCH transport system substrate-binding protein
MLTRFVRTQLIVFTIAGVIGVAAMVFGYMQVPTWAGIGHIKVTMELPGTGGLYRFANVTYRGVQIGKVSSVDPTATGAKAILSLEDSPKIPADVEARVRSVSAVGEQYVDLVPRSGGPPYLTDGAVIQRENTTVPQKVGPVLDQLNALVGSVPKDKLTQLLDESFHAFNGAGYDVGSLLDSGSVIAADADKAGERTRTLIEDSAPLIDSQAHSIDDLRSWTRDLNAVTGQIADNDPQLRTVLDTGPATAQEVSHLLDQIKPTLPVLLANLTTVGEVGLTYNPSLRQLLVLLPPYVAGFGSLSQLNNPVGLSLGAFSLMNGDPPVCTVGFLPPSQWRSPADETVIDTPDDLYCKLPQDSPISVRGVRNNPCIDKPGKRAPTVEICDSDQPFMPLAMHQHVLGPYPFDPNQVAQGVPPDGRANLNDNTYAPVEGTPMPPDASEPPPPEAPPSDSPAAVPNSFSGDGTGPQASAGIAQYDPRTGRYVGTDGQVYQQSDLAAATSSREWKDLLPVG